MKNLKQNSFVIASLIIVVVLSVLVYWLYSNAKNHLYQTALDTHHQTLQHEINRLVEDRREASMGLALAIAENKQVQNYLCLDCERGISGKINLAPFLEKLAFNTNYSEIWVQVIDAKGVSRYRSWTPKADDSLVNARADVRRMILAPRITQSVSVGKFSLTFKSMVPLFDGRHRLLGFVETVSHLSPLARKLKELQGVDSVVLVDQRYRSQLTKAHTGMFLNDFYVANSEASRINMDILQNLGEQQFTDIKPEMVSNSHVITQHLLKNDDGLIMGYWFTFSDLNKIGSFQLERLKKQYLYGLVVVLSLSVLLVLLFMFKQRSDNGQRYYRHILDSASEIVLVTDEDRILEANQQFFEFFSEFTNLDGFLKKHSCVCDTFLERPGYLQKRVDGEFWIDHMLRYPEKRHQAQIMKDGVAHYFDVTVAVIDIYSEPLYSVIMHDVTEMEVYKQRLEVLSETDTLTGISNRLVFNRSLLKETQRAHRYHQHFCLLMFDIDHFKEINDSFGHDVGDQVLITICETVNGMLRETDVFSRIGGEEFTIIMPETSVEQALQTAERLREAIDNLQDGSVPKALTVSFGVVEMTRWDSAETLLKRADNALYKAKEKGRNRVELAKDIQIHSAG